MSVLVACSILPPWLAEESEPVLRAWASRTRQQAEKVSPVYLLMVAMNEELSINFADLLKELRITPVVPSATLGIPDAKLPFERFIPTKNEPDEETLRHCFAFPIAARIAFMAIALKLGDRYGLDASKIKVWFTGLCSANPGTVEQLAAASGLADTAGTCVVVPQPEPQKQVKVIVDLPGQTTAIVDAEIAAAHFKSRVIQIEAPSADGFGWALASLETFSLGKFKAGKVPVVAAWLSPGKKGTCAHVREPFRAGEDFGWFWSVRGKARVVALI